MAAAAAARNIASVHRFRTGVLRRIVSVARGHIDTHREERKLTTRKKSSVTPNFRFKLAKIRRKLKTNARAEFEANLAENGCILIEDFTHLWIIFELFTHHS